MNKAISLIQAQMDIMEKDFKNKIDKIPYWQLKSFVKHSDLSIFEKDYKKYLIENFKNTDFLYQILKEDILIIKNNSKELKIFSIKDRFLEAKGYSSEKIDNIFNFIDKIKSVLN
ncbi:hypothetical protein [Capnocytophaga cynodegmi]|uniref:Uncharacterized protein n=1 Tax=Capnocytophaga cynodegmi TaxID=28189 RepID=A0A0B7HJ36_9FLAO|nr:hypothetical protein [Capnocytophaga cynodegmi]CEN39711.1 conserved hypothetical protein [Capnocytophaga cynodegmi]